MGIESKIFPPDFSQSYTASISSGGSGAAVSEDGIAAVANNGTTSNTDIDFYDVEAGTNIGTDSTPADKVTCANYGGGYFIFGCDDGNAYIYDKTGTLITTYSQHTTAVTGVAVNSEGTAVACEESDGHVFNAETGSQISTFFATDTCQNLQINTDYVWTREGGTYGSVSSWVLSSGSNRFDELNNLDGSPYEIDVDGRYLAVAAGSGAHLLNSADASLYYDFTDPSSNCHAIGTDKKYVLVGSNDNTVYCYSVADGSLLWSDTLSGDIKNVHVYGGIGVIFEDSAGAKVYQLKDGTVLNDFSASDTLRSSDNTFTNEGLAVGTENFMVFQGSSNLFAHYGKNIRGSFSPMIQL